VEPVTPDGRVLLLRRCAADGSSYGGFQWPLTVGAEVDAPDWNSRKACGGGLHGLPWACGDWGLLDGAIDVVFSAAPADVVDIDGKKSKVRRARVEHVGPGAVEFIASKFPMRFLRGQLDPALLPGRSGYGYGSGDGDGSGDGYGSGYGDGSGDGDGSGYGSGYGDGYGSGYGSGYGDGYGADVVRA
jgi:hypothetical protein